MESLETLIARKKVKKPNLKEQVLRKQMMAEVKTLGETLNIHEDIIQRADNMSSRGRRLEMAINASDMARQLHMRRRATSLEEHERLSKLRNSLLNHLNKQE